MPPKKLTELEQAIMDILADFGNEMTAFDLGFVPMPHQTFPVAQQIIALICSNPKES